MMMTHKSTLTTNWPFTRNIRTFASEQRNQRSLRLPWMSLCCEKVGLFSLKESDSHFNPTTKPNQRKATKILKNSLKHSQRSSNKHVSVTFQNVKRCISAKYYCCFCRVFLWPELRLFLLMKLFRSPANKYQYHWCNDNICRWACTHPDTYLI